MRKLSLAFLWLLFLAALSAFLDTADEVYRHEGFAFDRPLLDLFHGVQSPPLTAIALFLSHSASAPVLGLIGLVIFLWAYRKGFDWQGFAVNLGGAVLLNQAAKLFFARQRPHLFPQITPETDYSFPSGHTMGSLAFVLSLYLLLAPVYPKTARLLLWFGLPWAFFVALSRIYLQVHYPSDILGGWTLTIAWILGAVLVLRQPVRRIA